MSSEYRRRDVIINLRCCSKWWMDGGVNGAFGHTSFFSFGETTIWQETETINNAWVWMDGILLSCVSCMSTSSPPALAPRANMSIWWECQLTRSSVQHTANMYRLWFLPWKLDYIPSNVMLLCSITWWICADRKFWDNLQKCTPFCITMLAIDKGKSHVNDTRTKTSIR